MPRLLQPQHTPKIGYTYDPDQTEFENALVKKTKKKKILTAFTYLINHKPIHELHQS